MKRRVFFLSLLALFVVPTSTFAIESELWIVTSFPKDLFEPYKKAFEAKYPGTTVNVRSKGTSASIAYVRETTGKPSDIFWASAPDAFEVLKGENLLQKYTPPEKIAKAIPQKIGTYPVNDPDGLYRGFAASGYGIMWNTRYLQAHKLSPPKEWDDLAKPIYFGHVGMSAPSRSGTTHLTVETLLQGLGWERGWALVLALSGNMKAVTERSFGVPSGVNSAEFGIGVVIDFFGLSSRASGFPVEFVYPSVTAVVPANIGIIANASHPKAAEAFVDFVLSEEGQLLLLNPGIRRLPVLPSAYEKAPADYPNPFKNPAMGSVKFDVMLSKTRYSVVNALFDAIVTFRHEDLKAAWKAIHEAEARVAKSEKAKKLLLEAKKLASSVPITEQQAADPKVYKVFKKLEKGKKAIGDMAAWEQKWDSFARNNYAKAAEIASQSAQAAK